MKKRQVETVVIVYEVADNFHITLLTIFNQFAILS